MTELTKTTLTVDDALNSLNYVETTQIRTKWNLASSQIEDTPIEYMYALAWILEQREGGSKISVAEMKLLTVGQVTKYFAEEDPVQTEDSEQGKDESNDDNS